MQKLCMVYVTGYDRSRLMLILAHKLGYQEKRKITPGHKGKARGIPCSGNHTELPLVLSSFGVFLRGVHRPMVGHSERFFKLARVPSHARLEDSPLLLPSRRRPHRP
jgi:hypothetical protein